MFRFARLFRHNDFQLLGRLGFVDEEAGAGRACLVETLALPGDTPVLVAGEPFEAVMAAVHEYQATPAIRSTGSILLTTRPIGRSRSCARRCRRRCGRSQVWTARWSRARSWSSEDPAFGFNAQSEEYGDMYKFGVIDPAKVVRTALQDAASVAGLLITTEAMIADKPEPKGQAGGGIPGGGMGDMM